MTYELGKITLKAARVNAGLTQKEAAQGIGISAVTLSSYEKGHTSPRQTVRVRMAAVYGVPVELLAD